MPQAAEAFSIEVPLPHRDLSPNARVHWAARARETKKSRLAAWYAAKAAMPKGWKPCAVVLDMEYRCNATRSESYRPRDTLNAAHATKALIDGLVDAGVMPDDSAKWLSWGRIELKTKATPNAPGVTFRVTAATTA